MTTPYVHPQARAILDRFAQSGEPPLETLSAADARAVADARVSRTAGKGPEVGAVESRFIAGPAGPVEIRIYHPAGAAPGAKLPITLYFHGGGFVVGNLDTADTICREITHRVGCITVSAHYRLAPEHKFPAAIEDTYAAAVWVARHAAELGGDPTRIVVAGESAGGTIGPVVSVLGRDSGAFKPVLLIMIYPMTEARTAGASYDRLGTGFFLTRAKMQWFVDHYLRSPADADDPRASPLLTPDLRGLPRTLVITGSLDPLVDEGEAFVARLHAAGVPATYRCYEGWPHGFVYWPQTEAYARVLDDMTAALKQAFD